MYPFSCLGRDFNPRYEILVPEQVTRLIEQATLYDNLCQCYIGNTTFKIIFYWVFYFRVVPILVKK